MRSHRGKDASERPSVPPQGHVLSAIPEMSVAEIRRALSKLRDIWASITPETPLFICDKLHNDKSIAEFSKEFVFGHHLKRHYKSVTQTNLTASRKKAAAAAAAAAAELEEIETPFSRDDRNEHGDEHAQGHGHGQGQGNGSGHAQARGSRQGFLINMRGLSCDPQNAKRGGGWKVEATVPATAVPGPKGDADDPFPFASTWVPKTQRGKRAFELTNVLFKKK